MARRARCIRRLSPGVKIWGLRGAIVYRGLEGFGASARIYHARSLSISKNAPIMVSVIDR